jgi:hypothetical protein
MENQENMTILKDELKTICEELIQQMHQIDGIKVPAERQEAKASC